MDSIKKLNYPGMPLKAFRLLPVNFQIQTYEDIKPVFETLENRVISSEVEFRNFILDFDEIRSYLQEDFAWRYIRMTCDTSDEKSAAEYSAYLKDIFPGCETAENIILKKIKNSPWFEQLNGQGYDIYKRNLANRIDLFREENLTLIARNSELGQEYDTLIGAQEIELEGKKYTAQQALKELEKPDRARRSFVWFKVNDRRTEDADKIHSLLDDLLENRIKIAQNAGFESFTGYRFRELERFDYSEKDCLAFHNAVETSILPVATRIWNWRKKQLNLQELKPWDLSVDPLGKELSAPFSNEKDLVEKTILTFTSIRPELGEMISNMYAKGYMDLESRPGKAPGGYNYPLMVSGIPFIFMNAAGRQDDVITMIHEGGHAVHSFLTNNLEISDFKSTTAEVAEIASMAMEQMALFNGQAFYPDPEMHRMARLSHLCNCITILPWIATVDAYQFWLYSNPGHSREEREQEWTKTYTRFHGNSIDWVGQEKYLALFWQKQPHIFDVPFYYIEYGFAQLGALAIFRNYRKNPQTGVEGYLEALKMGYTDTIPSIYNKAGIEFDFSGAYMDEIASFVLAELELLGVKA